MADFMKKYPDVFVEHFGHRIIYFGSKEHLQLFQTIKEYKAKNPTSTIDQANETFGRSLVFCSS